jgi:hypothetical protein
MDRQRAIFCGRKTTTASRVAKTGNKVNGLGDMKTLSNLIVVFLAISAGLISGSIWKKHRGPREPNQLTLRAETVSNDLPNGTRQRRGALTPPFDDSPLATELQHKLSSSSGVTNWLCWMGAVEKAQPSDFPRLLRLARGHPAAWDIVVNRWSEIAPRQMFDTLVAASRSGGDLPMTEIMELGRNLFDHWIKNDREAAVAALNESAAVGMRDSLRMEVASRIVENSAERGLELMSDWHIEHYGPRMNAVEKWADANPRHAAEFALAHPAGYASQLTMETIGKEWAKTDPSAALDFAASHSGDLGSRLGNTVLKAWAGRDLNAAADWLAATDEATRNRLSPAFLETWAAQDASAALSWSQENLQGTRQNQAVSAVVRGAAEKDVTSAATMVADMQPGPARTEAAGIVAQKWFPEFMSTEPVKPELLKWLSGLDQDSIRSVLNQSCWKWANSDPQSMAKFLAAAPNEEVPPYIDSILARTMARGHPEEALKWAATLPEGRALEAGSDAFGDWHQSQPEAAAAWLNTLPANDSRRAPFFEKMIQSLAYGAQAAEQLSALSPVEKAVAQKVIAGMSLPQEQRTRLLNSVKTD